MKKISLLPALLVCLGFFAPSAIAGPKNKTSKIRTVSNSYIVEAKNPEAMKLLKAYLQKNNIAVVQEFNSVINAVQISTSDSIKLKELEKKDFISSINNNYLYQKDVPKVTDSSSLVKKKLSWALDRVDQKSLPLDGKYEPLSRGKGTVIYLLDSGIREDHKQWGTRASTILESKDDTVGHGTHTGGIAAGETCCNDNEWGVASEATLVSFNMHLDNPSSDETDTARFLRILDYVSERSNSELAVMSASFNLWEDDKLVNKAIREIIKKGVPFVTSAGNNGDKDGACTRGTPSNIDEVIVVGAVDQQDRISDRSNYGKCVDIFAPGVDVISGGTASSTASKVASGTSMATPMVAAALAILRGNNPDLSVKELEKLLKNRAIKDAIKDPKGSPNLIVYIGKEDNKEQNPVEETK